MGRRAALAIAEAIGYAGTSPTAARQWCRCRRQPAHRQHVEDGFNQGTAHPRAELAGSPCWTRLARRSRLATACKSSTTGDAQLAGNGRNSGELELLAPGTGGSLSPAELDPYDNVDVLGMTPFVVGLPQLKNLALDFNPITTLAPLVELSMLERLSLDGPQSGDLAEFALLRWPTTQLGVMRGLTLLSLDYVGPRGLSFVDLGFVGVSQQIGKVFIAENGPVRFSAKANGSSALFIDGVLVYQSSGIGATIQSVESNLTRGWHTVDLRYIGSAALYYDPSYGPLQEVPESILLATGAPMASRC